MPGSPEKGRGCTILLLQRPEWPEKYLWGLVTGTFASLERAVSVEGGQGQSGKP